MATKVITRRDGVFEQLVMGEVLIPDTPNTYGDIYSRKAIVDFCYEFARQGFGIDVNHDNVDIKLAGAYVVESFVARDNDPDFIPGSWVVGMKITDDALWQRVLTGDIAGYSFEAICNMEPIFFQNLMNRQIVGFTEPDPVDGHKHAFVVITSITNIPLASATGETDGHTHKIIHHTVTEDAVAKNGDIHAHRYQVIQRAATREQDDA